jgi:hypothetical protein
VRIADAFMRLKAKRVLFICRDEANNVCGLEQLFASLEAGIEQGGIQHAACLLWQTHVEEEEQGFLLVDANNAFNEGNRG